MASRRMHRADGIAGFRRRTVAQQRLFQNKSVTLGAPCRELVIQTLDLPADAMRRQWSVAR